MKASWERLKLKAKEALRRHGDRETDAKVARAAAGRGGAAATSSSTAPPAAAASQQQHEQQALSAQSSGQDDRHGLSRPRECLGGRAVLFFCHVFPQGTALCRDSKDCLL